MLSCMDASIRDDRKNCKLRPTQHATKYQQAEKPHHTTYMSKTLVPIHDTFQLTGGTKTPDVPIRPWGKREGVPDRTDPDQLVGDIRRKEEEEEAKRRENGALGRGSTHKPVMRLL